KNGAASGVPVLLGTVRDESPVSGPLLTPANVVRGQYLANMPLREFLSYFHQYSKLYPDWSPEYRRYRSLAAEEYWIPTLQIADAQVRHCGEVYAYRFDLPSVDGENSGLCRHGSELALIWN